MRWLSDRFTGQSRLLRWISHVFLHRRSRLLRHDAPGGRSCWNLLSISSRSEAAVGKFSSDHHTSLAFSTVDMHLAIHRVPRARVASSRSAIAHVVARPSARATTRPPQPPADTVVGDTRPSGCGGWHEPFGPRRAGMATMERRRGRGDAKRTEFETSGDVRAVTSFESMKLKDDVLRGLYAYGFEKPSAIQQRALTPILEGRDCIAQAQSGTGKTSMIAVASCQLTDVKTRE